MPAITFTGLNGIDFNSILDSVMQAESQPLQQLQTQQTNVQNKDSAFVSLAGIVSALQAPVTALTSGTAFSNVAASSSDSSIATVTAGDGGSIGQYTVSVSQLARAQVTKSTSGYSAATDVAATGGSISFTVGGTTTDPIGMTGNTTLSDLKTQINAQNSGVMASIVNDGTGYKLVISSRNTGATNGFTINNSLTNGSGTAVTFADGQSATTGNAQNAQDALLNVNGIDIQSASNSVSDAVPGATINLLKAGDVSVNVTSDYSSIKDSLNTLVTQYNNLRQFYGQQAKGPLGGDPVMREVLNDIKSVLMAPNANGGRYKYLSEIGLELTSSGDLQLDESKFDSAMSTNAADVAKLFQGTTSVKGAFNSLESTLDSLDGTAGLIKTARDSIRTTLSKYTDRIAQQQAMLDIRRQALQQMYAAADEAISRLNQMSPSIANLQNSLG